MIGDILFSDPISAVRTITPLVDNYRPDGKWRTETGFNQFGKRLNAKPESYSFPKKSEIAGGFAEISISTVSGALVGKIRTDIQNSSLTSLEFVNDDHGCSDFTMKLNRLPDFPIPPFSIISIKVDNTDFNWYSGVVKFPEQQGTANKIFTYRGMGFRSYLKEIKANVIYTSGTDIADVIKDLLDNHVTNRVPIRRNDSKLPSSTGVILASDIELGKYFLDKIFQTLADMANYNYGVDGDRDFFFEERNLLDVKKTHFTDYTMTVFEPKDDLSAVKNSIMLQRQQGIGAGGAGWAVAGIFNDQASIRKYGFKELQYQIPGFFSNADAEIIGLNKIAELAEPKPSAHVTGLQLRSATDFIERGVHRFILPLREYDESLNNLDDANNWIIDQGSGDDLSLTIDETIFVDTFGCTRFTYTNAQNAEAEINVDIMGKIERIRFYVRGSKAGSFFTVGVGEASAFEQTTKVALALSETFILYDWDVSSFDLNKIKKFGIRIDEGATAQTQIWLDKLETRVKGHQYYKMEMTKTKYKFMPRNQTIQAEFGTLPPMMENYIAALLQQREELNFTQEVV